MTVLGPTSTPRYRNTDPSSPAGPARTGRQISRILGIWARLSPLPLPSLAWPHTVGIAIAGGAMVGTGTFVQNWLLTDAGLILLGLAGLQRPVLWTGALLFSLPLYLYPLPVLPGRALNLIEIGVYGGLALVAARRILLQRPRAPESEQEATDSRHIILLLLVSVALVATFAAEQRGVALREWRTVFLSAALFALLLHETLRSATDHKAARTVLALAWLAGGAFVACTGLWQYVTEQNIIQAEGVNRVRAFFGSPNKLGLYQERTAAVGVALAVFGRRSDGRESSGRAGEGQKRFPFFASWQRAPLAARCALLLTIPQLIALLLTFSKGALFLGLPAMLLALAVAGRRLLAAPGSRLPARWRMVVGGSCGGYGIGALTPFLGTERFRSLLDLRPEGTAGIRLSLWRSSVQMALDHLWLGVGPDNFLYSYRSGYILPAAWRDPSLNHPHNFALDWWTRLGLPGLALAVAWLAMGFRSLWRAATADPLAVGALGAVAAALGHGLIDASYALPDLMLIWVFLLHLFSLPTAKK